MSTNRTRIITALAGLVFAATSCGSPANETSASAPAPVAAQAPATTVAAQPADVPTLADGEEFSVEYMDELMVRSESAPTLDDYVNVVGEMVAYLESDPTTGTSNWDFPAEEMEAIADTYGVPVEVVFAELEAHPVVGTVFNSDVVTTADASTVELDDGGSNQDEWTSQGPWNDHATDRCTGYDRPIAPVADSQSFMASMVGEGQEAYVIQVAEFATAEDAAQAFDSVDGCHVPAAAMHFLADIGVSADIGFGGEQVSEVSASGQFETWDMSGSGQPVALAAVQNGDQVIVALTYGLGVDAALQEAQSFIGTRIVQ